MPGLPVSLWILVTTKPVYKHYSNRMQRTSLRKRARFLSLQTLNKLAEEFHIIQWFRSYALRPCVSILISAAYTVAMKMMKTLRCVTMTTMGCCPNLESVTWGKLGGPGKR